MFLLSVCVLEVLGVSVSLYSLSPMSEAFSSDFNLPDMSGSSEAWSEAYASARIVSPMFIGNFIRMEIPSEKPNT